MQVKVEKKSDLGREIYITVPSAEVDKMYNERLAHLAKTTKLDGFRPGKVPADVIKKRFGEKVLEELADHLVQDTLTKAVIEHKIQMAGQPLIHAGAAEAGKDYTYHAHFDVYPEITPKKIEGIKVNRCTTDVDDKMVEDAIARLMDQAQSYKEKKGALAKGDRAVFDAQGFKKGEKEPFEGSVLTAHKLVIGSNSMIPGFEEAMVGMKAGDDKEFDVTFPKDYHAKELAGVKVKFAVQVSEVQAPETQKADDAFAKNFGMKDLAELKSKIREQLEGDMKAASEQKTKRELFDALDKDNQFAVPASLVESEFNAVWQNQMRELQMRGLPLEAMGNPDETRAEFRTLAERRVRLGLLLAEIGKNQQVKVEEAELDAEIARVAAGAGAQADAVKQYYSDPKRKQDLVGPIFEQKVVAWLMDKAKVTDKKVKAEELIAELGGQ